MLALKLILSKQNRGGRPDLQIGENANALRVFGLPVLALLGDFASQLVYNILSKLVTAAESVF